MGMKVCRRCEIERDISEFSRNKRRPDGYSQWCKPCSAAYLKEWRARPTSQEITAEYKATNYGKQMAQQAEYREKHRDQILAQRKAAYYADVEASRHRSREQYAADPERRRATAKRTTARRKRLVVDHYGGHCKCCGETELAFLCIDHVNGGGAAHRRQIGGGQSIYWWLVKNGFPEGFQVLCWNCNSAKHWADGCPHQRLTDLASLASPAR